MRGVLRFSLQEEVLHPIVEELAKKNQAEFRYRVRAKDEDDEGISKGRNSNKMRKNWDAVAPFDDAAITRGRYVRVLDTPF